MSDSQAGVLIVSDFVMLAALLVDKLRDCRVQSVDVADRLADAARAAKQGNYELALIDVDPRSEWQWVAAEAIASRQIPIAFVAAGGWMVACDRFPGARILTKPFKLSDISNLLLAVRSDRDRSPQ